MKRGLEIVGLAAIDVANHTGFHLEAVQTMVSSTDKTTLTQLYADMIAERKDALQQLSGIVVADAWFSKKPFVDQMISNGFDFISRLRDDAHLLYLYSGPKSGKRCRPQKYQGRVNPKDLDMDFSPRSRTRMALSCTWPSSFANPSNEISDWFAYQ